MPMSELGLKGRRFTTVEDIQDESQEALDTLTKDDDRKCFQV